MSTQGQRFFLSNLVAIVHSCAIWPLVDPGWPLHDLWPQLCITLWSGALPTKFGDHRAFLKQLDLWMTFDVLSGRFGNMLSNLVGPSPTPHSASYLKSTTKRIIAVHHTTTHHTYCLLTHTHTPHTHTHTHTTPPHPPTLIHRLGYLSSIEGCINCKKKTSSIYPARERKWKKNQVKVEDFEWNSR